MWWSRVYISAVTLLVLVTVVCVWQNVVAPDLQCLVLITLQVGHE